MKIQRPAKIGTLTFMPIMLAVSAAPATRVIAAAPSADQAAPLIDRKAIMLLGDVERATIKARSLTADFSATTSLDPADPPVAQEGTLQYLKPNFLHTEVWTLKKEDGSGKMARSSAPTTMASDGKTEWLVSPDNQYYQVSVDPGGKGLLNASDPSDSFFDAALSARKRIERQKQKHLLISLSYAGAKMWEGKKYDVVDWVSKPEFSFGAAAAKKAPNGVVLYTQHLYIGSDKLIHRLVYDYNFGLSGEKILRNVKIDSQITAKNFAYTLPAGAHPPRAAGPMAPVLANGVDAPDFLAIAPNGSAVHLSDYKGKLVVIDFWATWCGPCQAAMPHLEKVYRQIKDKDVIVLGVCVWDEKAAYAKWVRDKKDIYTFPTVFDAKGRGAGNIAGELYKVGGIPVQFVIGKDGKVAASNVGYIGETDHRLETELVKLGVDIPAPTETAKAN